MDFTRITMKSIQSILYIGVLLIAVACQNDNDISFSESAPNSPAGVGGSTARFTIAGNYLYTVDNTNLKIFNIDNTAQPVFLLDEFLDWGTIETIFSRGTNLFIGTQTGVFIYDISTPDSPQFLSLFEHLFACDPVVADDTYAYVTLRSGRAGCGRIDNQLDILDITDLNNPQLLAIYPMDGPRGLGVDGNLLFVCDDGLKVFDATDVQNLQLLQHFDDISANDVIPLNGNLLVIGSDGLYQYDYTGESLELLSKLSVLGGEIASN